MQRGRADQAELAGGEAEGELVFELDIGWQPHSRRDRRLAHVKSAFLPTRAST